MQETKWSLVVRSRVDRPSAENSDSYTTVGKDHSNMHPMLFPHSCISSMNSRCFIPTTVLVQCNTGVYTYGMLHLCTVIDTCKSQKLFNRKLASLLVS